MMKMINDIRKTYLLTKLDDKNLEKIYQDIVEQLMTNKIYKIQEGDFAVSMRKNGVGAFTDILGRMHFHPSFLLDGKLNNIET